jgi:hypothetical protein
MSHNEQDLERMGRQVAESIAKSRTRPRAVHEAGHAIVALHLGLPLESVDIEERDTPEGPKSGRARLRPIGEGLSGNEVHERVRNEVIFLLAGEAATKLILEYTTDPIAQFDKSRIQLAFREYPELKDAEQELIDTAQEIVSTRRADIEKLAGVLLERNHMKGDEVRRLIGD